MQGSTRRLNGMTLIELLVTLSILVVFLALAVPNMRDYLADRRLRAASLELITHINLTRQTATGTRNRLVMCASSTGQSCDAGTQWEQGWLIFEDLNADRNIQANENIIRIKQNELDSELTIRSPVSRQKLVFLPNGTSPGSNVRISLCDERGADKARAVVISNTGRIRNEQSGKNGVSLTCS